MLEEPIQVRSSVFRYKYVAANKSDGMHQNWEAGFDRIADCDLYVSQKKDATILLDDEW